MSAPKKNAAALQAALNNLCRNPLRLRVVLAIALAGGWFLTVYRPLTGQIAATRSRIASERKRIAIAEEIEELKTQTKRFHDRLPPRPDPNEAIQYLLDGVKALPVRLVTLSPTAGKDMGPYRTFAVKLTAEGGYAELDRLLRWLESNPRMFRIDEITIAPAGTPGQQHSGTKTNAPSQYSMNLTILGVIG